MIYTRYGSEIDILFGDIEMGIILARHKDDGKTFTCLISQLKADGGFGETDDAVTAAKANTDPAFSAIARMWREWLTYQPDAVRILVRKAAILDTSSDRNILERFLGWIDGLPINMTSNAIRAKAASLTSLTRSILALKSEEAECHELMNTPHRLKGIISTGEVYLDGKLLDIKRSLNVINKSPSGFAWGYYGSGPAQLALAILLELLPRQQDAVRYYQKLKDRFIGGLPGKQDFEVEFYLGSYLDKPEEVEHA